MSAPVDIAINNPRLARALSGHLRAGRHFLFVDTLDGAAAPRQGGRRKRLLLDDAPAECPRVHALAEVPVELPGITITPNAERPEPLAAVVADRDLYRAEEDQAHLLVVLPAVSGAARLMVECDGQPFTERDLVLENGATLVVLAALMAGRYQAWLEVAGRRLAASTEFSVAEYGLAPLSASLLRHEADRLQASLSFTLGVESWQQPCTDTLMVSLLDDDDPVDYTTLQPSAPGRYAGTLEMEGDGPFRLQVSVQGDPGRIATVAIPGTRRAERELTVLSELGKEMVFSLLPEPAAIPVRGGYLGEGDHLSTPFTVASVLTATPALQVRADASEVHLIIFDLVAGSSTVVQHGAAAAGDSIAIDNPSGLALVAVGCLVNGVPFEAFTTFMRPAEVALSLTGPAEVRPRETLTLTVTTGVAASVPVLLTVRDRRLTRTDTPASSLGASFKRGVEVATSGMAEGGIEPLQPLWLNPPGRWLRRYDALDDELDIEGYLGDPQEEGWPPPMGIPSPIADLASSARSVDYGFLEDDGVDRDLSFDAAMDMGGAGDTGSEPTAAAAPGPRVDHPPQLFIGLLQVAGSAELQVWSGDGTGSFVVEAFAYHRGDWQATSRDVLVDQAVRADLELPPTARPGDDVSGRLRVATRSGRGRVLLSRDGVALALPTIGADGVLDTPALLEFPVLPGTFLARLEDAETGEIDELEISVREPGALRSQARELILLSDGESISLEDAGALSLRVLPGLEEPFDMLVEATADYAHLCCEQTAAKILSAVAMYLSTADSGKRAKAESIICKGVAREQQMFRPGKGFRMYPDNTWFSDHYSSLAVRYLWELEGLGEVADLSAVLREAILQGLMMADDAGRFHGLEKAPQQPDSLAAAHAALTRGGNQRAALSTIDKLVAFRGQQVSLRNKRHAVAQRADLAYAAAGLLAAGDLRRGIQAANAVVGQFGAEGRLYSTVDSVAAIALMVQLRLRGVLGGAARVKVNGEEMALSEAVSLADRVESVECLEGPVAVQALALREERWEDYGAAFEVRVGLRDEADQRVSSLRPGQRVDLLVSLAEGYQLGDLIHVDLPACLSWLKGGGLVKQFTVDFEGKNELRIPLAVTGQAPGGQHFATCVRNMFEEERRANPGLLKVVTAVA